jgi:hypothetical protein
LYIAVVSLILTIGCPCTPVCLWIPPGGGEVGVGNVWITLWQKVWVVLLSVFGRSDLGAMSLLDNTIVGTRPFWGYRGSLGPFTDRTKKLTSRGKYISIFPMIDFTFKILKTKIRIGPNFSLISKDI